MRGRASDGDMAREASCLGVGGLAHLPQEAHRQAVGRVQRRAGRSAVLWMDRQPHQTDRRRPVRAQVHAAQSREQLVEHQHQALQRAESRKEAGRPGLARSPEGRPVVDMAPEHEVPRTSKKRSSRTRRHGTFFESLAPSHRRLYISWIDSAKRDETKQSACARRSQC